MEGGSNTGEPLTLEQKLDNVKKLRVGADAEAEDARDRLNAAGMKAVLAAQTAQNAADDLRRFENDLRNQRAGDFIAGAQQAAQLAFAWSKVEAVDCFVAV